MLPNSASGVSCSSRLVAPALGINHPAQQQQLSVRNANPPRVWHVPSCCCLQQAATQRLLRSTAVRGTTWQTWLAQRLCSCGVRVCSTLAAATSTSRSTASVWKHVRRCWQVGASKLTAAVGWLAEGSQPWCHGLYCAGAAAHAAAVAQDASTRTWQA